MTQIAEPQLRRVSRSTLGDQVTVQLSEMIQAGRWQPGQKLPPEAELCQALGVSRAILREGLRALAFVGMVEMRAGSGTYVLETHPPAVNYILHGGRLNTAKAVRDFTEARVALETELVALCAERATEDDLKKLEACLTRMERYQAMESAEFFELDLEFHLTIASASQNEILGRLLRTIRKLLAEYIKKGVEVPGGTARAYVHHRKIFDALKRRDRAATRQLMRTHLEDFHRSYAILSEVSQAQDAPPAAPAARSAPARKS